MTSITTKLVKDGNSTAVRLPKVLLTMSGLQGSVRLEARAGQIVIRQDKKHPRADWKQVISKMASKEAQVDDDDFQEMNTAIADGLESLPWDGLSYQDWLKQNAKHK